MPIVFTPPPATPAIDTIGLEPGGLLPNSTTYFYKIIAVGNSTQFSATNITISAPSAEVTETTDAGVNNTIKITWLPVAGAVGYVIFRTEISGDYTGLNRFCRASDNSHAYATVGAVTEYIDAGAATPALSASLLHPILPAGTQFPLDIDPMTYGIGHLTFDGGTSITPLNFAALHADAVANGWDDWCKWDGNNFVLAGNFAPTNNETHFTQYYGVFYYLGCLTLQSTHADSSLQFGHLTALGKTEREVTIYHLGNAYNYCTMGQGSKLYGVTFLGALFSALFYPYHYANFVASAWFYTQGGEFVDVKIRNWSIVYNRDNIPFDNISTNCTWSANNASGIFILSRLCDALRMQVRYAHEPRVDRFNLYNNAHQVAMHNNPTYHANLIDCKFPNTTDPTGLPIVYWASAVGTSILSVYYSLMLRIIDENERGVNNVNIDIFNVNGVANDIQGLPLKLTTDADGYCWLEKINITARTTNTITDASKAWVADSLIGRNVFCTGNGELMKVMSNTINTLTFTSNFVTQPDEDTNAGIKAEILRATLQNNGAAGTGLAFTTRTFLSPHEIRVSKQGYRNYVTTLDIDQPINQVTTLIRSPYV